MSIEKFRNQLPENAKDTKLNLSTVLTEEGSPDLTKKQIGIVALASAYAIKHAPLTEAILSDVSAYLTESEINGAQAAASIMGMNNTYYRFLHLLEDPSLSEMPVNLRMNVIREPGIPKVDFELCCLVVSAINGCGSCIVSHMHKLLKTGSTKLAAQSSVRIASVLYAAATAFESDKITSLQKKAN
jgi:alkyl hydroperoxide reductase subunit D